MGLFSTLGTYLRGEPSVLSTNEQLADLQAEAAWRTGSWASAEGGAQDDAGGPTFHGRLHSIMECLRSNANSDVTQRSLETAYLLCGRELAKAGIDGWPKVQRVLQKSLLIRETEEMVQVIQGDLPVADVAELWHARSRSLKEQRTFTDMEPLLSARWDSFCIDTALDSC